MRPGSLPPRRRSGFRFADDFGPVTVEHCAFWDNDDDCTGSSSACDDLFDPAFGNVVADGTLVVDQDTLESPDLRGVAERLPAPLDPTAIDEWFDPVSYIGAVPPEGEGPDWTREPWISWQME